MATEWKKISQTRGHNADDGEREREEDNGPSVRGALSRDDARRRSHARGGGGLKGFGYRIFFHVKIWDSGKPRERERIYEG